MEQLSEVGGGPATAGTQGPRPRPRPTGQAEGHLGEVQVFQFYLATHSHVTRNSGRAGLLPDLAGFTVTSHPPPGAAVTERGSLRWRRGQHDHPPPGVARFTLLQKASASRTRPLGWPSPACFRWSPTRQLGAAGSPPLGCLHPQTWGRQGDCHSSAGGCSRSRWGPGRLARCSNRLGFDWSIHESITWSGGT